MSGGIKYRLSPRERTLVADQLGVLESVRDRVKGTGLDLKIQDQEMEVSVEEKGEELSYELTYPLDNDHIAGNGRIYIKDVFRLNRQDGKLLGFERNASQKPGINEKIRYWIEVARRDHPQAKINGNAEQLTKFLGDLSALPKPSLRSPAMKGLLSETLPGLHRPFPDNSKSLVDANFEIFSPIRDSLQDLGLRMKFGDPQSGLSLRREGRKLILGLQLVLDTDAGPGIDSENNGRIYLNDVYEIDSASGKILSAKRSFTPSKVPSPAFETAAERLSALSPLQNDSAALEKLTSGWLEGLGAIEPKEAPSEAGPPEPTGAYGKALWRWYQRTGEVPTAADLFLPRKPSAKLPAGMAVPADPERRQALRRVLAAMLSGDPEGVQESVPSSQDPIFQSLAFLSRQESAAAEKAIAALPDDDELASQVRHLIDLQKRAKRLDEAFPLLELALTEMTQRQNNEDRAWSKSLGRAFSGDSPVNPDMRRIAVDGYLRRLRSSLEENELGIGAAIQGLEGDGPFEKGIKELLRDTPALQELSQALDEHDEELRQDSLVHLARNRLKEPGALPATALAIAERYAASNAKAAALKDWLSGNASFGQKFESSLGHFSQEVANPFTLGTMMLAGGASKVGKLAFVKYFGNTGLGLKIGAEAFSVGLEATVFVGSEKLYRSAFQSPVGVWDKAPRDLAGALLAFGILRGGGIAGRRFQGSLRNSEAWQSWLEGRTKITWAEKPLQFAVELGKAEGRSGPWKQRAGNLLAKPLRYVNETGLPRAWLKPTADFAVHHGLTLSSLMLGNSLSRFAGLRQGSGQGWKADLVDDALLYGHFYFSGQLMQRMGPGQLDYRLAALESAAPQVGSRRASKTAETSEASPEAKAEESRFEIPPALSEFGRSIAARFAKVRQGLRRQPVSEEAGPSSEAAPSTSRFAFLQSWLQSWRNNLAGLRMPWSKSKSALVPPTAGPNQLMLPSGDADVSPSRPTRPSWAETLPPPAELKGEEVFLLPMPLELPLRFVPVKAKTHLAVSWTGSHDNRSILPVSKNTVNYECIIGREELQSRPEATGADFGLPSTAKGVEAQHAKISYQVKLKLKAIPDSHNVLITMGVPDKITATVENLAKSSATFVNGKRVKSATLRDGDRIQFGKDGPGFIFHQESPEHTPTITQAIVPLAADRPVFTVGRESQKTGSPDIAFPMSSRDISVEQARILRDAEGTFYIQDQGKNLTLVNGMPVYGTQMLNNQDRIRFGEGQEFIFRRPPIAEDQATPSKTSPLPHPRSEGSEPAQAELHPALSGLSAEEVQAYFQKLGELDRLPLHEVRAASLETPDGRPLLLMTRYTGWSVGEAASHPATTQLQFRESGKSEANPFLIYMTPEGEFILKPLKPEAQIAVQPRQVRFWHPKAPAPQGPRLNVEGWVKLRGGERIFSGDQPIFPGNENYFDFWIFSPSRPSFDLPAVSGETPKGPAVIETDKPGGPPLLAAGAMPLQVRKSLVIQSEKKLDAMKVEPFGDDLSVGLPEKLGKVGRTTVYHDGDSWKIHTENSGEVPLLVNDIPLPSGISLPITAGSELSIGSWQFRLEFPE